jgi:hypothetical protein
MVTTLHSVCTTSSKTNLIKVDKRRYAALCSEDRGQMPFIFFLTSSNFFYLLKKSVKDYVLVFSKHNRWCASLGTPSLHLI